jgi:hypothetical protein
LSRPSWDLLASQPEDQPGLDSQESQGPVVLAQRALDQQFQDLAHLRLDQEFL